MFQESDFLWMIGLGTALILSPFILLRPVDALGFTGILLVARGISGIIYYSVKSYKRS